MGKNNNLIPGGKRFKKGVNDNEKRLVKEYIKNGFNKRQAALKTYDTKPENASAVANIIMKKPHVAEYLSEQLDKIGLSTDDLNGMLGKSIRTNLDNGKPSQAVGASMIQFAYKLHNVIPANKSVKAVLNISQNLPPENIQDVTKQLQLLTENSAKMLEDLKK